MSDPVPRVIRPFEIERSSESPYDQALRFYRGLYNTNQLFRKADGSLWVCFDGAPPRRLDTVDQFRGYAEALYHVYKEPKQGQQIPVGLTRDHAGRLFNSPASFELPELKHLIFDPCIICDPTPRLTEPGFDSATGVYYYLRPGTARIVPVNSTHHLQTCFSGVPFERIEYRNNLIGWLLSALILEPYLESPLLVLTGNTQGIGKTKTMEATGLILTGESQLPIQHRGEEFEKQLSSRFCSGSRFICFDNITTRNGTFHNDWLASLLTQGKVKKARILKESKHVEQSGVLFALTANHCKLDDDLSCRALPVKLYRETSAPMKPFVLDYAQKHRREIYAELLGLVFSDYPQVSSNVFPDFRFRAWLLFCLPRVLAAFGPMALLENREVSDASVDFFNFLMDMPPDWEFTSQDLIAQFSVQPQKLAGLIARFEGISQTNRGRELGRFLSTQIDKPFVSHPDAYVLRCTNSKEAAAQKKPKTYKLEVMENGNPAPTLPAPSPNPL